ncbi:MAG TPA: TraR/DksA family transcriptional regulator [Paludibaculum sp.]|jgi:DnaK suppressor protein
MTKSKLNSFRRALETGLAELGNGNRNREVIAIEPTPDEMDRVQHVSDRDYAISSLERNSNRLGEIRRALHRMDTGTFGLCLGCDEEITPKRLAALPWASYCIACQDAAERGENAQGDEIDTSFLMTA